MGIPRPIEASLFQCANWAVVGHDPMPIHRPVLRSPCRPTVHVQHMAIVVRLTYVSLRGTFAKNLEVLPALSV